MIVSEEGCKVLEVLDEGESMHMVECEVEVAMCAERWEKPKVLLCAAQVVEYCLCAAVLWRLGNWLRGCL